MKKKHAFYVALMVTLLIGGNYLFFGDIFPERELVVLDRVIDGDTVELEDGRKIRLLNINTPEEGEHVSEKATEYLKEFEGEVVELEVEGVGKYGRILGRLFSGRTYLNLEIVERGLAHSYIVESEELSDFKKAEKKAQREEIGIWKRAEDYGCLNAEINKKDEFVSISDGCSTDFEGWSIKDESTSKYFFGYVKEEEFLFYSGDGIDGDGKYYWGRGKAWNDDKDSIFIRNEAGELVYYDSYGY
jgi:endonuclease YncB( thermonuclease family)